MIVLDRVKPVRNVIKRLFIWSAPALRRIGVDTKGFYELAYWRAAKQREGTLQNSSYESLFTTRVGVPREFYRGKSVLDIGCGPRGSLEWLDDAAERVGLDPLVGKYRGLGIDSHKMRYVEAGSEAIPFPDGVFDIVTLINSLDHVDDLEKTVAEVKRVLAPGGTLLIVVDVHPKPTAAEPITLQWDVTRKFQPELTVKKESHFEHDPQHRGAAAALNTSIPFDHDDPTPRYGALLAVLVKRPPSRTAEHVNARR